MESKLILIELIFILNNRYSLYRNNIRKTLSSCTIIIKTELFYSIQNSKY